MLDGRDVTDALRTEDVSRGRLAVAVHPGVRRALLDAPAGLPRAARAWSPTGATWARSCFPDAQLKVFLTASAEAARRAAA